MKPAKDAPCNCGSGKNYENCCEGKVASSTRVPSIADIGPLVALFNAGRYVELESRALSLVGQHPDFGFGWKLLGGAFQMQGKNALPAFQKAAELMPDEADAHYNLGVVQKSIGLLADAEESYRRALQIKPDYAEAYSNLGNVLKDLGKIDDAVASYHQALALKPNSAETHNSLGIALKELGQFDAAMASYRRALVIKPNYADAHYNLANVLKELGQLDEAVPSYRRALEIKPDLVDAHNNLGAALKELGQLEEAVISYRQALELEPDFVMALNNLGAALKELGQSKNVLETYRRVVELEPDSAVAHNNLGKALKELGQSNKAVEIYRRALVLDPECIEAMLEMGLLHMENGDMTEAEEMFLKVLAIKPDNLNARLMLTSAKKVKAGDENVAALLEIKDKEQNCNQPIPDQRGILLQFALGKCFDDMGDYDRAFLHFAEGCRLKRATLKYDAEKTSQKFTDIMHVFSRETIDSLRGIGDSSRLPIFVLGMPRSGTTLTEQIIASHPDVHGGGELPYMLAIAGREIAETRATYPENILALDPGQFAIWGRDYVAELHQLAPDARHITDKTPVNFLSMGLIHIMLPNAKIIHVNRNPVDTCLSCFTQIFNKLNYTYDLSELGRYYVDYVRLMEHWRRVLPAGSFLDVQYEEIVADQETQARRIIGFCGLDWNDACIEFHTNKRSIRTASLAQVRQPIYKSSVERWRSYEKYLGPLLEALGDFA